MTSLNELITKNKMSNWSPPMSLKEMIKQREKEKRKREKEEKKKKKQNINELWKQEKKD